MRALLGVVWLAFAVVFFALGREEAMRADQPLPPFESEPPHLELSGANYHLEFGVSGTLLDEPFREYARQFDEYLTEQRDALRAQHRRAALGLYAAAAAALGSALLSLRASRSGA